MPGSPHPTAARRFRHGSPHPSAIPNTSGPDADEEEASAAAAAPDAEAEAEAETTTDEIPELLSIAPAIFVPAKFDYTQPPPDLPPDTVTRASQQLQDLDAHTAAVKSNIRYLVEQQARRIHRDAARAEESRATGARGLPLPLPLAPERSRRLGPSAADEAAMLRNLDAPAQPGRPYGVPLSFGYGEVPPMAVNAKDTPREAATTRMLNLMRYGMQNVEGYEQHAVSVRNARMDRVRKDVAEETAKRLSGDDRMDIE